MSEETAIDRVVEFLDAWEADRGTGGSIRGGNADMPYLFVSDLRTLVADAKQLRAQGTEYGIRADWINTLSSEGPVAETLGDALKRLDEFDAMHGHRVVSRELVVRPVGVWRKVDEHG